MRQVVRQARRADRRGFSGLGAIVPFALIVVLLGGVSLYNTLQPGFAEFDPNALPSTAAGPDTAQALPDGCGPVESMAVLHQMCRAVSDFVRVTSNSSSR